MRKISAFLSLLLLLTSSFAGAQTIGNPIPLSQLPYGGLLQSSDQVVANRSTTTMRMIPFQSPPSGSVMISNGTASPAGISPINGYCVVGINGAWSAQPCTFNNTVIYSGTPTPGNLTFWSGTGIITNGNLSGDATTSGSGAVTVAKINGATLGTTTATSGNLLIGSGTAWQTRTVSGDCTISSTGAVTCSTAGGVAIVTTTGTQTLTNKSIDGSEINSGTVLATYLPTATTGVKGIVQIGAGIGVSSGTISLAAPTVSVLGGIIAASGATSNSFMTYVDTTGTQHVAQPAFSNLSGQATLAQLPSIASNTVLSNVTGGSAVPAANSISAILDTIASVQGDILYRNASSWVALAPGTAGAQLTTGGAAANPSWVAPSFLANSLSGDVTITTAATYYDGPTVAQGSSGTWCASGTITVTDSTAAASTLITAELWDGTTVISTGVVSTVPTAGDPATISLSGCLATPAGNLRISATSGRSGTSKIVFNSSGKSKDSTITAWQLH